MLVFSSTNIVKILMALLVDFYHCCDKFRNRYAVALLVEVEYTLLKAKLCGLLKHTSTTNWYLATMLQHLQLAIYYCEGMKKMRQIQEIKRL